jgi:hypothetical protein
MGASAASGLSARVAWALVAAALCGAPACKRKPIQVPPQPPAGLEQVVAEQAQAQAPDAAPVGPVYRGVAWQENDATEWQILLEPGSCYWLSVAGDVTVAGLQIHLYGPARDRLAKRKERGPRAVLAHCAASSGMHTIEVKVSDGAGHFFLGVYASKTPAAAPVASAAPGAPPGASAPPPAPSAGDLVAVLDQHAAAVAPGATRTGTVYQGTAEQSDYFLQLEGDKCYWVVAAGDASIAAMELLLWDPRGKRLADHKPRANRATVGHCPAETGMFKIRVEINKGAGRYAAAAYARKK